MALLEVQVRHLQIMQAVLIANPHIERYIQHFFVNRKYYLGCLVRIQLKKRFLCHDLIEIVKRNFSSVACRTTQ